MSYVSQLPTKAILEDHLYIFIRLIKTDTATHHLLDKADYYKVYSPYFFMII